jgi:hypothetical protein
MGAEPGVLAECSEQLLLGSVQGMLCRLHGSFKPLGGVVVGLREQLLCLRVHVCVCLCVRAHMHTLLYVHVCVCMYVCVCFKDTSKKSLFSIVRSTPALQQGCIIICSNHFFHNLNFSSHPLFCKSSSHSFLSP